MPEANDTTTAELWGDLTVSLSLDGAAFTEPAPEVGRILRGIAQRIEDGHTFGYPLDVNGNACGEWEITLQRVTEDGETQRIG